MAIHRGLHYDRRNHDVFETIEPAPQQKGDRQQQGLCRENGGQPFKASGATPNRSPLTPKVELPKSFRQFSSGQDPQLNSLNGAEFDDEYNSMQVAAHKDAVSLFERYAKNGDHAGLKAFAAKTLPHLQQHLKMAQELK